MLIFGHNITNLLRSWYYRYYNRLKFRLTGIRLGRGSRIYNSVYVNVSRQARSVTIGDHFTFTSGGCFNPLCRNLKGCIVAWPGADIQIGHHVGMSSACVWIRSGLTIGDHVEIGGDVVIIDSDQHSLDHLQRRDPRQNYDHTVSRPIEIGDDAFIGARSIILKGVHIGPRAIIGAGSVVTKDIPADCIAAGNPCRVIRHI